MLRRKNWRSPMRQVIVKRIIKTAQQGVKDELTLVDDAVRFLAAHYRDVGKQRKQPAWTQESPLGKREQGEG